MKKTDVKVVAHKSVYKGRAVHLAIDKIKFASGEVIEREIIYHPGSAVMIAMPDRLNVFMIRQFRYSVGGVIWEFPAGTMEPGEKPELCAARELEEEIGYAGKKWIRLSSFYPTPGVSNEIMHLFLATGLVKTESRLEEDELLEVRKVKIADVGRMIENGTIRDGKTILGFHILKEYLKTRRFPLER